METVCEALIANSILAINSDIGMKGLEVLVSHLLKIQNGIDNKIFDHVMKSKIEDIYETCCDENPKYASKVKKLFEILSNPKKKQFVSTK